MKKKPPPGATLIARLREQRLAREAAISGNKPEDAGANAAADPKVSATESAAQVVAEPSAEPATKSGKTIAKPESIKSTPKVVTVETDDDAIPVVAKPASRAKNNRSTVNANDLIHREIDIEDLRPTTDDYFQLTDEIRLAGRFAAVGLIAQGLRLARLKDEIIYKEHYATFEEYCRKEHQMSATYAYRLIRMAEMAERIAERGAAIETHDAMPDPFEVMLGLGHRHLMALLPLEPDTAEELLVRGIPLEAENERVPITRATEKQIRQALKTISPTPVATVKVVPKKPVASEKQLIPALNKLVEMLEDWAVWLGGDAPEELKAARIGRGPLLNKLAKRFKSASTKIADALEQND
jgi:hypothetical protein